MQYRLDDAYCPPMGIFDSQCDPTSNPSGRLTLHSHPSRWHLLGGVAHGHFIEAKPPGLLDFGLPAESRSEAQTQKHGTLLGDRGHQERREAGDPIQSVVEEMLVHRRQG